MRLNVVTRHASTCRHHTPLLFVHGMFHGAWCWEARFLEWFAARGYDGYAVDLRGHGGSDGRDRLRWTRIADFVADVERTVDEMPASPVLIGHSMGGFVLQKYLEQHDAAGVVLLSSPPPSGLARTAWRIARRHPLAFVRTNLTLSLAPVIATPTLAREAFFSADLPEDELCHYWRQMQDESYMALLDMVALDHPTPAPRRTPVLVLGAERDNMLTCSEIVATARAYRTTAELVPDVAHDSMLDTQWQNGATRILGWLRERGM